MRPLLYILLLSALWPGIVNAAVVDNLYQARVPVKDHSTRQLGRATRTGLAQVLVKVSGNRDILGHEEVLQALGQSQKFMQQYQYLRQSKDELQLDIQFDPQLVTEVLTRALLPVWVANRPSVLVWLVVDDASDRHFASIDADADLLASVRDAFDQRGVPVEFPLYDLQDTVAVSVHDLWQLDSLPVYRASQRYHAEDVLVGRMRKISGQRWMGDWQYLWEDQSWAVTQYGEELDDFVAGGVRMVTEQMAARYAVAPTGEASQGILVRVDGISRYADFHASLEHLQGVQLVNAAVVAYVEGDSVLFRLRAQIQPEQLQRVIALQGKLELLPQALPLQSGLPPAELVYRWNP